MPESEKEKIVAIMKANCLHAYLATCDGDQPRLRPVSPIVEDDMSLWITTFCSSRKVEQLKYNPKICLAFVDQPNGDRAATVIGSTKIVSDIEAKRRIWQLATFDLSQYFKQGPESSKFCLLKIITKQIEWRESWTSKLNVYKP